MEYGWVLIYVDEFHLVAPYLSLNVYILVEYKPHYGRIDMVMVEYYTFLPFKYELSREIVQIGSDVVQIGLGQYVS